MGKHSGPSSDEDATTPYGPGPHPTPEESAALAASFDAQLKASPGNNCTNPPHYPPHCGCPAG